MRRPRSGLIEFRVLGPVEAVRNGITLPLGGRRQRALLALLLLEAGRPIAADRLIDELWHGEPPGGASTTLRSYVSRLRTVLGEEVLITRGAWGYALDVLPERVDASRFERLVGEGQAALARGAAARAAERLRTALELWRGRPLAGLADDGALRLEAERLEDLRLGALEKRIEAELSLGRDAGLVEELEALVREHPYRERLWRHLMLGLYRAERQADALAAYGRARALLDTELGLEPGEELRRLEQSILRHEVPPARPPEEHHNLPAPLTSFVGRESELADLDRLLGESRLITLTGVGGAGKTRLALEAAARAVPGTPDGVFFVDFSDLAEPALVPGHVATALDVPERLDAPVTEQLGCRLRDAELLLVLDNCEHLREACAEVAQSLLVACPGLRVLATSRELLGVPGEIDFAVPPLALPSVDADRDELRSSEAVGLFLARAREARPRLELDDQVLATAARICRDLDGLPLALELAAARAKALSLDEIAARLTDRFRFLVSWRRLTAARHRTLEETMDWSYELLAEEERVFLARLSVFAGGFTLDAAANVCLERDDARALELVGRLVDASLLVAEERESVMRYHLLETVRQYAAERLAKPGAGERRHAEYYLLLAEQRSGEIEANGLLTPLAGLEPDDANLRASLLYFQRRQAAESELRLCAALWRYWWFRGQLLEGRQRLAAALEQAPSATVTRAGALRGASALALRQGDYEAAAALGEESAQLARELDDTFSSARALVALANAVSSLGDYARAERLYRESAAGFRAIGQSWELANVLLNMGDLALNRGDFGAAERLATEGLAHCRTSGDDAGIAVNLGNIAFAALERGDADRANGLLLEALERSYGLGFREWVATMLEGLAAAAAALGAARRAAKLLGASARLREEIGVSLGGFEERLHGRTTASAAERLDDATFKAAYAAGHHLSAADAVALALSRENHG